MKRGKLYLLMAVMVLMIVDMRVVFGQGPTVPQDPFPDVGDGEADEDNQTVGPKCRDPFFQVRPGNAILNACCHKKFIHPLPRPQNMPHCFTDSTGKHHFGVTMKEIYHDFGVLNRTSNVTIPSRAWAYGPDCTETFSTRIFDYAKPDLSDVIVNSPEAIAAVKHNVPAPTFPVVSNEPLFVLFKNELPVRHLFQDWLDSVRSELHCGLMAPNCKPDSRTVIHFHGGHTLPQYDGFPNAWFTQNSTIDLQKVDRVRHGWDGVRVEGDTGEDFFTREYYYQVDQEAGTFWYHDHSMGITALNVYSGMAGLLLIRDQREHALQVAGVLPSGRYEMPLVLKDYWFNQTSGQLMYDLFGEHEFFANYSGVNGVIWPYMEVEPTRYRFRILNSCNSRIMRLTLMVDLEDEDQYADDCDGSSSKEKEEDMERRQVVNVTVVVSDGGLLTRPASVANFWMTPAERYDIVVDFSPYAGKNLTLHNIGPVELGLPWKCPPNCAPSHNTGPDRWVRFVVGKELATHHQPKAKSQKEADRMAGLPRAQEETNIQEETLSSSNEPHTGTQPTDSTTTDTQLRTTPTTSGTSSSQPTPTLMPSESHSSPPMYPPARRRSWFDSPTSISTSPFPSTLRGLVRSGSVDRVRQIILIEVSHDVAFRARHHHPGDPVRPLRRPTIVIVNEDGEVHNNNNLKHGPDDNQPEDEIYMFTINDPRLETGVFFDDIVNTGEACTTERWELINISNDTHAVHIHQIEFELIGRANFSFFRFGADPIIRPDTIRPAEPYERGPKDVFLVNPGEIAYVQGFFDLHGRYVTHCHMLEHEDMEMMHQLEMKPSKCKCVESPLLREDVIIPAVGLPFPYGMDADSVRERLRRQATHEEQLDARRDATSLYEEWRAELLARHTVDDVSPCAGPVCSAPPPLVTKAIFPCATLPVTDNSTCPVNFFSDFLFLRDRLSRLSPLECEPDPAADIHHPEYECDLVPQVAKISINDLHSSVCPGQPKCRPTEERVAQSEAIDQKERTSRAIAEDAALQAVPPGVRLPGPGLTAQQILDDVNSGRNIS